MSRIAIQVISYNRPEYLEQTLSSLKKVIGINDKICVIEQSDDPIFKKNCVDICNSHNIILIDNPTNSGQRGATNIVYYSGFFNNSQYVMLSDHDNIFHEPLDIYVEKLDQDKTIWCASGYCSLEHDIERKDWEWLIKSTARAGHLVFRTKDFIQMMPIDVDYNAGTNCSWFAGLDWYLTWWNPLTPGYRREKEFIACYPGGVEHAGKESCWQGLYTKDDPTHEDAVWMQLAALPDIIKKYPPQHQYLSYPYSYEEIKEEIISDLPVNQQYKEYNYNIFNNNITVFDFPTSQSPDQIYNEIKDDVYNIQNVNFRDGDIVLDLGANIGIFSIALAKKYPKIKIFAFEPLEKNYNNLLRGIKANNIDNIIPINCAITSNSRKVLAVSSINLSGGAMVLEKESINEINTNNFIINSVNSISLVEIFEKFDIKRIKLLKMDIEGFEYEVIKNSWEVLNKIEYFSGEFHFIGGEGLKHLCQEFFKEDKLCIRLMQEDLRRPKDPFKILESLNSFLVGNPNSIIDDVKKIIKSKDNKIHVLIPTYQRYDLLRSLLTDTAQQRYKNFDVFVCSDGFDKITKSIVEEFNTECINEYTYIFTSERANDWGRSPREKLISMIPDDSKDYIVLIDDDDVIDTQYLEKLIDGASQDTISYCNLFLSAPDVKGERIIPAQQMTKFLYGYISVLCCLLPVDVVKKCFHKWTSKRDTDFDFIDECTKYKKLRYVPRTLAVAR